MRDRIERHVGFLKTTALGGVVFLLPLIVVGWLVGQAAYFVWLAVDAVREPLDSVLPFHSATSYTLLLLASLALVVLSCFGAGLLARRSIGKWFTGQAERYLLMLFPRYAVFKDQLTGNLGEGETRGRLKPVFVRWQGADRIGMEVERDRDAVTVYLPTAPDPWTGEVVVLPTQSVQEFRGDVGEVMATFEQLGRGTQRYLAMNPPKKLVADRNSDTVPPTE